MSENFTHFTLLALNLLETLQKIEGELYRVDQRKFDFLDQFEEYPHFYTRELIEVTSANYQNTHQGDMDGARGIKNYTAWVYLLSQFKPYLLTLPFHSNYDSFGPHNLPFVVRSKRPPNDPHELARKQVKQE